MRLEDIGLDELLDLDPDRGIIRFSGQRVLLLDAVALGLLRRQLVESLGWVAARAILWRFGYAHGWRTAESLRDEIPWESEADWRRAGGRLHTLQGLVHVEPLPSPPAPEPFAHALWRDSYEAEQHLLHLGRSSEPVCWTLAGFASGYLSFANGREIVCREERCAGMGHPACHLVGRPREEWARLEPGAEVATVPESFDEALRAVSGELRRAGARSPRRRQEPETGEPSGLVARSEAMRRAVQLARRVARADVAVLVVGESGVGKERVARLVHAESRRAARPFVALNCGAIPEALVESELFGHARGAFTGAAFDREGLFEAAEGGTLFLDEVGELPPAAQPKLLRALETREVRRVGDSRSRSADVRVVAATNRDLSREVAAGRFRRDLYYRLKVVEVAIPPLRQRREDVLPIARRALQDASVRIGRPAPRLSARAADQLLRHRWPGNARELWNAMERAALLAEGGRVDVGDLPEEVRAAPPDPALPGAPTLAGVEREYVLATLRAQGGNRARAARQLGIGEATLYRRLRAWRAR